MSVLGCRQLPRCCRLLRRIVMHNIRKATWCMIICHIIFFILFPMFLVILAYLTGESQPKTIAVIYSMFALCFAYKLFVVPVRSALDEAKKEFPDRSRMDVEASAEAVPMEPVIAAVQRSRTEFWNEELTTYHPHWPSVVFPRSDSDTLKKVRVHNERFGPEPDADVAETSFSLDVESSEDEGKLRVTHRSLHPSRSSEDKSNPSSEVAIEVEAHRPSTSATHKVHEI